MIFLPLCILIVRELWLGMMRLRASVGENDPGLAFVWAFVLAGFINAFFQSTFEAPYAAVAFWSMLAVLCVMNRQVEDPTDEDEDVQTIPVNPYSYNSFLSEVYKKCQKVLFCFQVQLLQFLSQP